MNCEERGCQGTVRAVKLTARTVMLNCTKCTRQYHIPYTVLRTDMGVPTPQLPESVYTNIGETD